MADERSVTSTSDRVGSDGASRTVSGEAQGGDKKIDHALRPRSLGEMIGQDRLRDKIGILVEAARQRGEALDHVLLYGPPGLGKTTLSHILAHEMNANLKVTAGPAIEKAGDLAAKSNALAGSDPALKRDNWRMVAAARRAAGDIAGARAAEQQVRRFSR